jgi:hypothetical protein
MPFIGAGHWYIFLFEIGIVAAVVAAVRGRRRHR